jgi:hypothetical protein
MNSNKPKSLKPTYPRELSEAGLFAFKEQYEHLKFLKKQQWTITNYVALIYGAIFGVNHLSDELTSAQVGLLKWFAVAACAVGLWHVVTVECHMLRQRTDTARSIKWIFGEYKEGDDTERAQIIGDDDSGSFWRDLPFLLAFMLVIGGGAVLVWWFI